jgi:opacity protein-like surface antigen
VRARLVVSALALAAFPTLACAGGLALDAAAGYQDLTRAKNSAKAVFNGASGGLTFGGGLRYGLGEHLFVAAWGRYFGKSGERVFVADAAAPVFRLGHPLRVRIVPIQGTIGYRFGSGALVPYAGIGGGLTMFHEESTVGGVTSSISQNRGSGHALAGLEYGKGSIRFAGEVMYLLVPNAIGIGGVSKVYGETDIGGFSALAKVVFAFP